MYVYIYTHIWVFLLHIHNTLALLSINKYDYA